MLKAEEPDVERTIKNSIETTKDEATSTKPLFVYPLLAAAIVAVSSAAVAFSSMSEISPCLLAYWRTQFTAAIIMPSGVYSICTMTPEEKKKMLRQAHLIAASGILLGCHFGTWVLCIENTSLSHALLTSSCAPIIIAVGAWMLRKPISKGELVGTAIAAVGMVLIAQSAGTEKQVTLYGDGMGIICVILYVFYLSIGRSLRSWMPLFAYVFPLFSLATITLGIAAVTVEGARFNTSTHGLFGQYGSWHYLWRSLYLGTVPGIVGHVSFNALLKWLNPLVITLAGTSEPLIGEVMGLVLGVGSLPGLFTYIGGTILIASTIMVIMASYKREKMESQEAQVKAEASVGLVHVSTLDVGVAGEDEEEEINDEAQTLLKKMEEASPEEADAIMRKIEEAPIEKLV